MTVSPAWNLEVARKHVGRVLPCPYPCGGTWTIVSVDEAPTWSDDDATVINALVLWNGTGNAKLDGDTTCGTFEPGGVLYDHVMKIDGAFTAALLEDPQVVGTYLGEVALKTRELMSEGAEFETALGVAAATVRSRMPVPLAGLEVEAPISFSERSAVRILTA